MTFSNWFASRRSPVKQQPKRLKTKRLQVEALEDRTVPTVTLGNALSIGHELGASNALAVAADSVGNSYMTGYFSGTTDFDPAHTLPGNADVFTARGDHDIFISKHAPDGSLMWVRRMGGDYVSTTGESMSDTGMDITVDGNGNVFVTGEYLGSSDFGAVTLTSAGDRNGFVTKLNSSGNVLWARQWGAAVDNRGYGIGVDGNGNVYACIQAAGGTGPTNGVDILKFNANGNTTWTNWVNTQMFLPFKLAISTNGSVFLAGSFSGSVDFDPGPKSHYVNATYPYSNSYYSGFVLNLTTNGKFGWVTPFVGLTGTSHGYSIASGIALDASGSAIVGGYYRGPVDFNPGNGTTSLPTSGGGFITKLNGSGGLVWAKALEGDGGGVSGLAVNGNGSIYATGSFSGTIDLDPGAGTSSKTSAGGTDIYVMKLDSSGNFGWAESFGSTGNDAGTGIDVDSTGTIHLAGSYQGVVDFDPTDVYFLTNPGPYYNMFLVRLYQS